MWIKTNFDYEGAKNAGYSNDEINKHLLSKEKTKPYLPPGWKIEEEPKSPNFFSAYFPTFFIAILIAFVSFIFGLYVVKGIAKTINWVIKGFRE